MNNTKRINNACQDCAYYMEHFVKAHGEFYLIDDIVHCQNKKLTKEQIKKRTNNEIACEYFKLQSLSPSTELENIAYALCGIMGELYEIKKLLKEKKK